MKNTPVGILDIAIITLTSFFSPMVDGKEKGVGIAEYHHVEEPEGEDVVPSVNVAWDDH